MKYKIIQAARSAGLLPLLDRISFMRKSWETSSRNKAFLARNPGFKAPPKDLAFDAYNMVDWELYDALGAQQANALAASITARRPAESVETILEWGCGPGRLIRHMGRLFPDAKVIGTDYNPKTIDWCKDNLDDVEFHLNGLMPPLPLPDDSVDATYNFSVLTHLSVEAQQAWVAELYRVLKPGGVLVGTTHGDDYKYLLVTDEQRKAYDEGEVVLQENYEEGLKWYFSLHPPRHVREQLLSAFENVELIDGSSHEIKQDIWVAEKPRA